MLKTPIFKIFIVFSFILINSLFFWILSTLSLWFLISLFYLFSAIFDKLFLKDKVKNKYDYLKFLYKNFYKISIVFLIIYFLLFNFIWYQIYYNPPKIPQYILTNWDKKVIFQTMSHIWSSWFYREISEVLNKYRDNWYVFFYEWVRPWSKENHDKFNKLIWFNFSWETYTYLSKLYWLVNQNNSLFLWNFQSLNKNVDISMDDIIKYYEERGWKYENEIVKIQDIENQTNNLINSLNSVQLFFIQNVNKSIFSMFMKNQKLQNIVQNNFTNKDIFSIILDKRNEIIANEIINWEEKNIFVMYWMLHYNWVFDLLKKSDSKWRVENIIYFNPLK